MIYVGIDIAKRTHYASVMNSDGEILAEPFPFTNDHAGFQKLLSCIINPIQTASLRKSNIRKTKKEVGIHDISTGKALYH